MALSEVWNHRHPGESRDPVGAESRERKLIEEKLPGAQAFPPAKYAKVCVPADHRGHL